MRRHFASLGIQGKLAVSLTSVLSLFLVLAVLGWVTFSRAEDQLKRHQESSLGDLDQILTLARMTVDIAAAGRLVPNLQSMDAIGRERVEFERQIVDFKILAATLPRPYEQGGFSPTELPAIVRLADRLDMTIGNLFLLQAEMIADRQAAQAALEQLASVSPDLRARAEQARFESGPARLALLESSARPQTAFPAALAAWTEVFASRRQQLNTQLRTQLTVAVVEIAASELTAAVGSYAGTFRASALQRGEDMIGALQASRVALIAGVGLCLLTAASIAALFMRRVIAHLTRVTDAIVRLASGDETTNVPSLNRPDEIGRLARAFTVFKRQAAERDELAGEVVQQASIRAGILNNMRDGIALFDRNDRLVTWNPQFERMIGRQAGEMAAGSSMREVMSFAGDTGEPAAPSSYTAHRAFAAPNAAGLSDGEMRYADGRVIEVKASPMPEGGTVVTFADISQRRQMEQRLRDGQRLEALGQFTAGIAHDFNNLLTATRANIELIVSRSRSGSVPHQRATSALSAVQRGNGMVRKLLTFARTSRLKPEAFDMNAMIEELVDLAGMGIDPKIAVELRLSRDLPLVLADPVEFETALLNLIFNARDAITPPGSIVIETGKSVGGLYLSVADDGHGMAADVASRAFDPFFTTKPSGSGHGLGLSTVYGFVRQSGGEISIDTAPGSGCAIRMELPSAHAACTTKRRQVRNLVTSASKT